MYLAIKQCYTWAATLSINHLIGSNGVVVRADGVVVRASASQSVNLGSFPLLSHTKRLFKDDIHSFPAWRSAFMGGCGEQAGKFACCVLGQGT